MRIVVPRAVDNGTPHLTQHDVIFVGAGGAGGEFPPSDLRILEDSTVEAEMGVW